MRKLVVVAHDIRSAHNIGSLLRTCDGLGVECVYMTGYTPHPLKKNDDRLPHIASRVTKLIHKTALGAESSVKWNASYTIEELIPKLRSKNYKIIGLELVPDAIPLQDFYSTDRIALILGNEIRGITKDILEMCDDSVCIQMLGKKESLNVTEAASMALFYLRYIMNTVQ